MQNFYNKYYNYDNMFLWEDETWSGFRFKLEPLLKRLKELDKAKPHVDHYADRADFYTPNDYRCKCLQDVMQAWQEKGMYITCNGMTGLTLVPEAVKSGNRRDALVLYVPRYVNKSQESWAMNLIEDDHRLVEQAAKENVVIQFLAIDDTGDSGDNVGRGMECASLYYLDYKTVLMDIRLLKENALELRELPEYESLCCGAEAQFLGIPVVDVSESWKDTTGHQYTISRWYWKSFPQWDYSRHIHSGVGRTQADTMRIEYDYTSDKDPNMVAMWQKMGLRYQRHGSAVNPWVTFFPEGIFEQTKHRIPLLVIMKEMPDFIPYMPKMGFQFYYEFLDMAAQGQFGVLFFAQERPDDNDVLADIIAEAEKQYPVDPKRIYLMGQSHNGYYALEFYRRHPRLIAATVTLADSIGLRVGGTVPPYGPREIQSLAAQEMPLMNMNGQWENQHYTAQRGSSEEREWAQLYRNRLAAFRCQDRGIEDILAARDSRDYATRMLGVPTDRTFVTFSQGTEIYTGDVRNRDGKWMLRFSVVENTPHMLVPQMAEPAWSFLRRFARNRETGESIELY